MPIFDQGYQHWSGGLSGHAWRCLAIARNGVRGGLKNRLVRIVLLVSWLPAVALVILLCLWGLVERQSTVVAPYLGFLTSFFGPQIVVDPRHYRIEIWTICYDYFLLTELRCSMLLILLVGPNLISQDLRFNALPLYFSRPLRRSDYFLGKLGVIGAFLGLVVIVPSLIAYVFGLLFSLDITIVRDTLGILLSSIGYGLVIAISAGLLILALSSLSRNSRYVALFWLALWFVSGIVGAVLHAVDHEQRVHALQREIAISRQTQLSDRSGPSGAGPFNHSRIRDDLFAEEIEASKSDWRPLVSYSANLSRVGKQLLGTNACWESLGQLLPPRERARLLSINMGPQYPWYWSAAVLTGLIGLSVCILNFRIKSLDRLK